MFTLAHRASEDTFHTISLDWANYQEKFHESLQLIKLIQLHADTGNMTPAAFGVDLLARVLDGAAFRHQVIAQNVANVNTPGYRRRAVVFEEALAHALEQPGVDLRRVQPRVVIDDGPMRVDGNTVDIEREVNDLNRNALLYQAAAQVLASRIASLRAAVSGR